MSLRKAGLGYLLAPAYKKQRIEYQNQLGVAQEQINIRQQELKNFEQQISDYERSVNEAQEQANRYEYLRRIASRYGNFSESYLRRTIGLTREEASIVKDINAGNRSIEQRVSQLRELNRVGLTPQYDASGRIAGFLDARTNQTIPLQSLPNVRSIPELQRLENSGAISITGRATQSAVNFTPLSNSGVEVIKPMKVTIREVPAQVLRKAVHFIDPVLEAAENPGNEIYYNPKKGKAEWRERLEKNDRSEPFPTAVVTTSAPTPLEIERQQSLVPEIRSLPPGPKQIPFLAKARETAGIVTEKVVSKIPLFTFSLPGTDYRVAGAPPKQFVQVSRGFVEGLVPTTKQEVLLTVGTVGIGAAVGGGLRAGGAVLRSTVPKVAPFVEKGSAIVGVGLTVKPTINKVQQLSSIEDPLVLGREVGSSTRNLAGLSIGTKLGFTGVGKGVGYLRTFNLEEVPQKQIIEPGFFKGQRFPKIEPGTTPQLLREEFKVAKLLGEDPTVYKGFSARVQPFRGITEKGQARPGELTGTYIAPGISPSFFRAGEKELKFISFSEFGTLPTAERITLVDIRFAEGVKPIQKSLRKSFTPKEARTISEEIEGTGTAVIPFIKTEKEAVLGAFTPLRKTAKRFFLKDPLSGERVPIIEREVVPTRELGSLALEKETISLAKDVYSYLGSGRSSAFGPIQIGIYSVRKRRSSSPISKRSSSALSSLTSISGLSNKGSSSINRESSLGSSSSSSSISGFSSSSSLSSGSSIPSRPSQPSFVYASTRPGSSYPGSKPSFSNKRKKKRLQTLSAYRVFLKRRGQFVPFSKPLPRGVAIKLGSEAVTKELSRQFKLVKSGTTDLADIDFRPRENILRSYRVVRGRKVDLPFGQYIQRTKSLLQTPQEKELIRQARIFSKV